MRGMLELVSILAVGFFIATVLGVTAIDDLPIGGMGKRIDYGSLGFGLVLGVTISTLARIGWSELPRRLVAFLVASRATLRMMTWGLIFAAVLVLY